MRRTRSRLRSSRPARSAGICTPGMPMSARADLDASGSREMMRSAEAIAGIPVAARLQQDHARDRPGSRPRARQPGPASPTRRPAMSRETDPDRIAVPTNGRTRRNPVAVPLQPLRGEPPTAETVPFARPRPVRDQTPRSRFSPKQVAIASGISASLSVVALAVAGRPAADLDAGRAARRQLARDLCRRPYTILGDGPDPTDRRGYGPDGRAITGESCGEPPRIGSSTCGGSRGPWHRARGLKRSASVR